ncbi:MAG: sigma-70 family RNA polymerase sigma factor [Pseudomonadota bacterium]
MEHKLVGVGELVGSTTKQEFPPARELVLSIGAGNAAAEQALVEQYWKGLYFILKKRCNDPQLAADLVQDTFIIVISKARNGEIKTPEALTAFVRQTGVNLMLAHFRKENRRATEAYGEVNIEIPDQKSNLTRAVESGQTLELVQQLINELTVERDRDILMSYFVKEEDKGKICERLDLTTAHFDRVLFRARARLKQLVEFKLGGENVL